MARAEGSAVIRLLVQGLEDAFLAVFANFVVVKDAAAHANVDAGFLELDGGYCTA